MTCHALNCPNPALPGMLQCWAHWMMLPEKTGESRPWVRPVPHNASFQAEMPLNASRVESGQMELFA